MSRHKDIKTYKKIGILRSLYLWALCHFIYTTTSSGIDNYKQIKFKNFRPFRGELLKTAIRRFLYLSRQRRLKTLIMLQLELQQHLKSLAKEMTETNN